MSPIGIFILGLLVGWVIEWIIDWIYWRRRLSAAESERASLAGRLALVEKLNADLKNQLAAQERRLAQPTRAAGITSAKDDLEIIIGIGPVIAGKLNQAGIYSFEDLAKLTPDRLQDLVGDVISRLADEKSIIDQAKALVLQKERGG